MMLMTTLPTADNPFRMINKQAFPQKVRVQAHFQFEPSTSLLRTNQAADVVSGPTHTPSTVSGPSPLPSTVSWLSPFLSTNLVAYFALHTHLAASQARTYKIKFATADEAQYLNATAIEAVYNDGRESLLEAKIQETTARQCSASFVRGSHVESAEIADLSTLRTTLGLSQVVLNPRIMTLYATQSISNQRSTSLSIITTIMDATEQGTSFSGSKYSVTNVYGTSKVARKIYHEASRQSNIYGNVAGPSQQVVQTIARSIVRAWFTERRRCPEANDATNEHGRQSTGTSQVGRIDKENGLSAANKLSNKRPAPPSGDEEDLTEYPRRRKRRKISSSDVDIVRLFACPYHKYDPSRYSQTNLVEKQYRGCSHRYLPNIARLKYGLALNTGTHADRVSSDRQHLQRIHERPKNYCGRCYQVYSTRSELDEHTNQALRCAPSMPRYTERMTDEQSSAIRRKHPKETAEENWYRIWRILFPGANAPASPFVEKSVKGTVDDFLRYFRLRAPAHINAGLHAAGLIPASHLVQHNTGRVLDEAISQILTEYNIVSSQGNTTSTASAVETQESTNVSASPPECSSSLVATASVTSTLDTSLTVRSHATSLSSFDNTHDNPPLESTTRLPQSNIELPRIPNIPPSGYYSNSNSPSWNLPSNPLDPILPQTWIDWQLWDPDGMLTSTG